MRRRSLLVVAAITLVALVGAPACSRGGGTAPIKLDGSPRYPSAEGVVTEVSRDALVLDGKQSYRVSKDLQSFSSSTLAPVPLLQRKDQYVQVGLDGNTVVWIAAISAVVTLERPAAFHIGTLRRVDDERRLIFQDGTVLRLGRGVDAPPTGRKVTAEIDPEQKAVRSLQVAPAEGES